MPYVQDINPNVNIPCQPGWCEKYTREAFGQPAKYATATAAWDGQEDKHGDRNQPGVAVPVYWGLSNNAAGHDAVWLPDGSVWSASVPNSTVPGRFANLEAIERYYGGKLQWRGWGTYVSHTPVAHWEEPAPNPEPTPDPVEPQGVQIGDTVTTSATVDQNGKHLNLAIINDGQSVFTEVNSKGNAVLRKDGVVRAGVPVDSLTKV